VEQRIQQKIAQRR